MISEEKYNELLDAISVCSKIYRKYDDGSYHNFDRKITLTANELGKICHVENIVWDDIKDKIYPDKKEK